MKVSRFWTVAVLTLALSQAAAPAARADQEEKAPCAPSGQSIFPGGDGKQYTNVLDALNKGDGTPLRNLALQVYPSCKNGKPVGPQALDQTLLLQFERNFPRPGTRQTEYLSVGPQRLALADGWVTLGSRRIGKVAASQINCAWTKNTEVKIELLPGETLTLHEVRKTSDCIQQREDDALIPLIDDDYTRATEFRLEIATDDSQAPLALTGQGATWYRTYRSCSRAQGDRVTTLRNGR